MRDYGRLGSTAFSREHTAITALVAGAGALGNEVIKNLALLGVRDVWIADRDIVEPSNLTRSILFCTPEIDDYIARRTPKAVLAAKRVREINPDVAVTAYVGEIADLGYGVIRRADLVFCCFDNEMARLELGWACARLGKPVADGGLGLLNYSSGQVSIFPGADGPCYACRKGADGRGQLLRELQGREDPCWRKEDAISAADGVATTPLLASVVAGLQVELGLRALEAPAPMTAGRAYQITLHPRVALEASTFERSPSCSLHDPESVVTSVLECRDATSDRWTVADLLEFAGAGDGCLVFDWPITSRARCQACGHVWAPLVRRARFRRQVCPACGEAKTLELEVLSGVGAGSEWSRRALADLGLPLGHVHEIAIGSGADAARVHVEMTGDLTAGGRT